MTLAEMMLPELARHPVPVLTGLFTLPRVERRAIFRRPRVLRALWRLPASELRTRALREAARG